MFHYPSIAPMLKYNLLKTEPKFNNSATQSVQITKKIHMKRYKKGAL